VDDLTLPGETRVAIAGDWHGNAAWVARALPRLHEAAPGVRTILHLGDFGFFPRRGRSFEQTVDECAKRNGIERILVTPGNHENWSHLDARLDASPDEPVRMSETVWALPRGYRFSIGGATFLSFGGAASVDRSYRIEGVSWWPTEVPTAPHVQAAVSGGTVDVMLTHETIAAAPPKVALTLATNPHGFPAEALAYSAASRRIVTEVWEQVAPKVLAHGHMHIADQTTLEDGRRIYSVDRDEAPRNLALLDLPTLGWAWVDGPGLPTP
jgi:hypothetical protein